MPNPSIHAFAEKVAVVAGVETPVGRAIAIQLALNGAFVVTVSDSDKGEVAVRGLLEIGTLASHIKTEIRTESGVAAVVEDLRTRFGRLDLLVDVTRNSGAGETESSDSANIDAEPLISLRDLMEGRPSPRIVRLGIIEGSDSPIEAEFRRSIQRDSANLGKHFRMNGILVVDGGGQSESGTLLEVRSGSDADDVARVAMFFLSSESKAVNGQVLVV